VRGDDGRGQVGVIAAVVHGGCAGRSVRERGGESPSGCVLLNLTCEAGFSQPGARSDPRSKIGSPQRLIKLIARKIKKMLPRGWAFAPFRDARP
jgi:hypothetical protein